MDCCIHVNFYAIWRGIVIVESRKQNLRHFKAGQGKVKITKIKRSEDLEHKFSAEQPRNVQYRASNFDKLSTSRIWHPCCDQIAKKK